MKLHELSPAEGSTKEVKRIGRGHGSGRQGPQGSECKKRRRRKNRIRRRSDADDKKNSEERF